MERNSLPRIYFERLLEGIEEKESPEIEKEVQKVLHAVLDSDSSLISVSKSRVGYGTWESVGFANEFHFGEQLANLLVKALSGTITHDEDKEFTIEDLSVSIFDRLMEV